MYCRRMDTGEYTRADAEVAGQELPGPTMRRTSTRDRKSCHEEEHRALGPGGRHSE
jgi:hypothetical protein